jgi:hypothetical protein
MFTSYGHCCACEGACWHIGGPWYCDFHKKTMRPRTDSTSIVVGGLTSLTKCDEHCYCREKNVDGKKHKQCCMCGHRKLKRG